jgi:hypothetical protein
MRVVLKKKNKTIIKSHFGDTPNREMIDFCGNDIIDHLINSKSNSKNGVSTYKTFEKDGTKYYALKELINGNLRWRVMLAYTKDFKPNHKN